MLYLLCCETFVNCCITEAITTPLVPLETILPEDLLLSLVLALLCGEVLAGSIADGALADAI